MPTYTGKDMHVAHVPSVITTCGKCVTVVAVLELGSDFIRMSMFF